MIVSLRNSRVDHSPQIAKLLQSNGAAGNGRRGTPGRGRAGEREEGGVFAIYGEDNTWLFKARNEREKIEWIFKLDQAYFGSADGSADDDDFNYQDLS
jgi:kinesin family protein 1